MFVSAAIVAVTLAQAPRAVTVEDELRRAKNEYAYGNYDSAVKALHALLYHPTEGIRLYSDEQQIDARKVLALSCYLLGREREVNEEFTKLLYIAPDYELDPFTIAPPIVELFEKLRRDLKPELDVVRSRNAARQQKTPKAGYRRIINTTVVEKSDIATLMPFGIGQFQNGDRFWGVMFALSEAILLGLNVGSYLWARDVKYQTRVADQNHGYDSSRRELVQMLTLTQFASAALFGVVWSIGVFHARLNFVPIERSRVVSEEPINDAPTPAGFGARLSLDF